MFKKSLKIIFLLIFVLAGNCFALNPQRIESLDKQIQEAKNQSELYASFEELTDEYFKESKFDEYAQYLENILAKKKELTPVINYYTALTRYYQLKNLEESQNWNEYFNKGNDYRGQIESLLGKTIGSTTTADLINIYAQLLLWRLNKDQDNGFQEELLKNLVSSTLDYIKSSSDSEVVKDIADTLQSYGEKTKSKELYKIYVQKLISANTDNLSLKLKALNFYKDANLELAEEIYDAYADGLIKEGKCEVTRPELTEIAKQFSYCSQGLKDLEFAEKIFIKLLTSCSKEAFDDRLLYLRGVNLEKIKDFALARDIYLDLASRFPSSEYLDRADYKIGYIDTYVLWDLKNGKEVFENLAKKDTITPEVISALYQLGLLSQWNQDNQKALEYYNRLIELAKENFKESVVLAQARINEIDEESPLEYNLKTFLDVSLKGENKVFDMTKADFKVSPDLNKVNAQVSISSQTSNQDNGCLQPDLQYLWSGDLGSATTEIKQSTFTTQYQEKGIKDIGLVVVSPAGLLDRNLSLIDIE